MRIYYQKKNEETSLNSKLRLSILIERHSKPVNNSNIFVPLKYNFLTRQYKYYKKRELKVVTIDKLKNCIFYYYSTS